MSLLLPTDRPWNVEEAAAFFSTTPAALRTQRYRGMEPGSLGVVVGKRLLFNPAQLEAWLEQRATGSPTLSTAATR